MSKDLNRAQRQRTSVQKAAKRKQIAEQDRLKDLLDTAK